ncbi:hypothetical protein PVAG01_05381 [Phlyctema vagabunda]|uniref:Uncharacterized protein n=1 Tax=Phlyctema vagabunda TaxID=108571 RepID=A0ABR4PJV6_9HELO
MAEALPESCTGKLESPLTLSRRIVEDWQGFGERRDALRSPRERRRKPVLSPQTDVVDKPPFWTEATQKFSTSGLTSTSDDGLIRTSDMAKERCDVCRNQEYTRTASKAVERQLCWYRIGTKTQQQEPYTAPSWSRERLADAGVHSEHACCKEHEHALVLVRVLDVNSVHTGTHLMGVGSKGGLTLSIPGLFTSSICIRTRRPGGFDHELIISFGSLRLRGEAHYDDILSSGSTAQLLLPVRQVKGALRDPARIEGLIIRPAAHQRPGEYERMGFFRVFHAATTDWQWLAFIFSYSPLEQKTIFAATEGGSAPYTISLV